MFLFTSDILEVSEEGFNIATSTTSKDSGQTIEPSDG
jgi:hypothetical protein